MRKLLLPITLLFIASTSFAQEDVKVAVGKQAPDFTVTGIDSKDFKLSDKIGKDKNIVLMFSRAHW